MNKKLVLKPFAVTVFYGLFLVLVAAGLFFSVKYTINKENDITYVSKAILDEYVPVMNQPDDKIIKPFTKEDINIEGLRKAKLSYYPLIILDKCHALQSSF